MRKVVLFLMLATFLWGCQKPASINKSTTIPLHGCLEPLTGRGQINLCLDTVLEDSRCPAYMECFWEGEAVARFTFYAKAKAYSLVLVAGHNSNIYHTDTLVEGYTIRFLDLYPHAGDKGPTRALVSIEQ